MIFRQLFDHVSSTYSYLLADELSREALLIDPVFEQHARDVALIRELELKLVYVLDTHCHADHVTGAWLMKRELGSQICLSGAYPAENIDVRLAHGDTLRLGASAIEVRATPGHTNGCLSFVTEDHAQVFTGDALLVRGAGRTDFQQGDPRRLFQSIREQLFTLPDDCLVYPAHDYDGRTASTIGEERRHNPRIGGDAREEDFIGYMRNLGLPHPKQIAVAVPANLRAGRPETEPVGEAPKWGPVISTYAGLPEIAPEWVALHSPDVQLVDVRGPDEFKGELGHLQAAQLIPLEQLRDRSVELSKERPVVLVCQTGKRSGMGTVILKQAGFTQVANMAGGMVRWRELGLPAPIE
jgi:glyoxylase-like metal-dependent hydrolase (beta-lactamase superfamily II)/rhodanese-related sulfurtransferase